MDTEMTAVKKFLGGVAYILLVLVACNKDPDITPEDDNPSGSEIVLPEVDPYYFFSDEDIESIRKNAAVSWGTEMVASYEKTIRQRLKYSLSVPDSEGGYGHYYYCPECNVELTFAFASPHSHVCPQCGKSYSGGVYDMAWISEVHNKNLDYLTACMYLYIIKGDKEYAASVAFMLDDYASHWSGWEEHSVSGDPNTAGRMFAQSLDEAKWLCDAAMAYKTVKTSIPESVRNKIEAHLFLPAAAMLKERKQTTNWQTWHNAAIASIGVATGNKDLVNDAIETPIYGFKAILASNLYSDGWWSEGSVSYHFYALQAMLKTAEAVRCMEINLYGEDLKRMFETPLNSVYSDLSMVTHNDGWTGASLTSYARYYNLAYLRYGRPENFASVLARCWNKAGRKGAENLLNPDDIPYTGSASQKSCAFNNIGFAILHKNEWSVVMKYGPHGGSHGHPDKLSITLHDGQKEILPDFGSPAYSVPSFQGWYKNTLSHNTVTVDGKNQAEATGELIDFSESAIKAKVSGAYNGVEMSRNVSLSEAQMTDEFTVTGDASHTYDYALLLTETPSISSQGTPASLGYDGPYSYIEDVRRIDYVSGFSMSVGGKTVSFTVDGGNVEGVYVGKSLGYPYQNAPTSTCWPVIIRVKGDRTKISAVWRLD